MALRTHRWSTPACSTIPSNGTPIVGFVARRPRPQTRNIRARPDVTIVWRIGWEWVAVDGRAEIVGPHDSVDGMTPADLPDCCERLYAAAVGGRRATGPRSTRKWPTRGTPPCSSGPTRIYSNRRLSHARPMLPTQSERKRGTRRPTVRLTRDGPAALNCRRGRHCHCRSQQRTHRDGHRRGRLEGDQPASSMSRGTRRSERRDIVDRTYELGTRVPVSARRDSPTSRRVTSRPCACSASRRAPRWSLSA